MLPKTVKIANIKTMIKLPLLDWSDFGMLGSVRRNLVNCFRINGAA